MIIKELNSENLRPGAMLVKLDTYSRRYHFLSGGVIIDVAEKAYRYHSTVEGHEISVNFNDEEARRDRVFVQFTEGLPELEVLIGNETLLNHWKTLEHPASSSANQLI